jgi:hypothetical protein
MRRTTHRLVLCCLGAVLALAAWPPVQARTMHALLVGASGYPAELRQPLQGPKNDVDMLRHLLQTQRGFNANNIVVLADGVQGAQALPLRANIVAALERLAREVAKGDVVLLYVAGHGSQMPADRNTPEGKEEPDGLHEIFLPLDAGRAVGAPGGGVRPVANAIADHEFRALVDKISAQGAFVWAIFDTCHAGTLVRSPQPGMAYRHIDPRLLGYTDAELQAARQSAVRSQAGEGAFPEFKSSSSLGKTAFFYATQADEKALEHALPLDVKPSQTKPYGVFTFALAQALATGQPMTYRQLGQHILTQFGPMAVRLPMQNQTPLFTGTGLDEPVLLQTAAPVRQWKLLTNGAEARIEAGALSGLNTGAVLAVVPDASTPTNQALAYLKAADVGLMTTQLVPESAAGQTTAPRPSWPASAYARLVSPGVAFGLKVALSIENNAPAELRQAVQALQQENIPGARIQWVQADEAADLLLRLQRGQMLLLPGEARSLRAHQLPTAKDDGLLAIPYADAKQARDALTNALRGMARVNNLLRLATVTPGSTFGDGVRATFKVSDSEVNVRSQRPLDVSRVPTLRKDQHVTLSLINEGGVPMDVTVLYIDSSYSIVHLAHQGQGSNRLPAQKPGRPEPPQMDFPFRVDDSTVGLERIMVIAVPGKIGGELADFSYLAQPSATDIRTRTQDAGSAGSDALTSMLEEAALGPTRTARGNRTLTANTPLKGAIQVFSIRVTK